MTPEELRTLALFNTVENSPDINQRKLAQELNISLGLTNTYFQIVLKKGWVRAKKVKPRRWLYFLTPKGVLEKSRLSLSYMHRTLDSFRELKRKGDDYIRILSEKGVSGIHLCGDADLIEILSFCFRGLSPTNYKCCSNKSRTIRLKSFNRKRRWNFTKFERRFNMWSSSISRNFRRY